MPALHVPALGLGEGLLAVEPLVEVDVDVTRLEAEHRSKRRRIGREAAVSAVDILTVGDGGVDGRGSRLPGRFGDTFRLAPGALPDAAAEDAVLAELELDDRSNQWLTLRLYIG